MIAIKLDRAAKDCMSATCFCALDPKNMSTAIIQSDAVATGPKGNSKSRNQITSLKQESSNRKYRFREAHRLWTPLYSGVHNYGPSETRFLGTHFCTKAFASIVRAIVGMSIYEPSSAYDCKEAPELRAVAEAPRSWTTGTSGVTA